MSFSKDTKRELAAVSVKDDELARAELAGIVYLAASISINRSGLALVINTELMDVVKRIIALLKRLYGADPILTTHIRQPKNTKVYSIRVVDQVQEILQHLGIAPEGGFRVNADTYHTITQRDSEKIAFCRGAFLGAGTIANPRTAYHIEFVAGRQESGECLLNILCSWGLNAKAAERRDNYLIYMKEVEHIITFLTVVGAHSALLHFEDIRIYKEIRNNVNRQTNCDSANIDRIVKSAQSQIENIHLISKTMGLDALKPGLKSAALLRLENPAASLEELAELSGDTTRSGMNHRLRKINSIANDILKGEVHDDLQRTSNQQPERP
jgi:DNA-binding protein WhiA